MDPITATILAALATGAAAGATQVATQAVVDGYNALKAKLKAKFGPQSDLVQAVEAVEVKPASEGRKGTLEEEVAAVQADKDDEILKAVQALKDALKQSPQGQQAMAKYNIQMQNSQTGVIGDNAHIEGGINFGKKE